jgi:hypothetical protein
MISYTGTHISRTFGAPNVRDIAVQSMRLVRFAGAGRIIWPVGMHSLFVADLLPKELKIHGLLHDAAECCVNDVPRPMKTDAARYLEAAVTARIYIHLGVPLPAPAEEKLIKVADIQAGMAEGTCGCGPRGYVDTMTSYVRDANAISILKGYLTDFTVADCMDADGWWPRLFEKRLLIALRDVHSSISYTEAA